MYIYKITNKINGKIYIGKTEKELDSNYFGSGILIKKSIKKYGRDNFLKEILEECNTMESLNDREKYWINFLDSRNPNIGYNIAPGGEGFDIRNLPNYQEIKGKMDKSPHLTKSYIEKYGEERSKEIISKRTENFKKNGKTNGDNNTSKRKEVREKISDGNKRKILIDSEYREKIKNQCKDMSDAKRGKTYEEIYGANKSDKIKERISESKIGDKNPAKREDVRETLSQKRKETIQKNESIPHWQFLELVSEETFNIGFGLLKFFCESKNIDVAKIKYRLSKANEFVYFNWKVKKL
jgi:group I intron endonuclease